MGMGMADIMGLDMAMAIASFNFLLKFKINIRCLFRNWLRSWSMKRMLGRKWGRKLKGCRRS